MDEGPKLEEFIVFVENVPLPLFDGFLLPKVARDQIEVRFLLLEHLGLYDDNRSPIEVLAVSYLIHIAAKEDNIFEVFPLLRLEQPPSHMVLFLRIKKVQFLLKGLFLGEELGAGLSETPDQLLCLLSLTALAFLEDLQFAFFVTLQSAWLQRELLM